MGINVLGAVATIVTPLAAATLYGWNVYLYLLQTESVPLQLAAVGGVATAIALECVGMLSGHVLMRAQAQRARLLMGVAVVTTLVYVWVGVSGLAQYQEVFFLAPCVYLLVGGLAVLQEQGEQARRIAAQALAAEHAQQAAAQEAAARQAEYDHAERMYTLETRRVSRGQKPDRTPDRSADSSRDWRTLPEAEKRRIGQMSRGEIARHYQLSSKQAGRWLQYAQELSAPDTRQLSRQLSTNGQHA